MRAARSVIRAAILMIFERIVCAQFWLAARMASRSVDISQQAAVCSTSRT